MNRESEDDLSPVWRALGDATRRRMLDVLREGERTTTDLVELFPERSRFAVMKHLEVLRAAGLVLTRTEGPRRINALNAVPIQRIYERWVSRYAGVWAGFLVEVGRGAEGETTD